MALKENIQQSSGELCQRFGIKKLGLFGSVARGDDTVDSDIDFFAEFDSPTPETMPDRYLGFIREASLRFGRDVQLLTPRMLRNPHLQRSIEKDLTIIHGQ
jgi:predicted nucleotidyltransferase